jgi:hypothetical protein
MSESAKAPDEPLFKLVSDADLQALPDPKWLIDQFLPRDAVIVLQSQPSSGKTFVALSMAAAERGRSNERTREGD